MRGLLVTLTILATLTPAGAQSIDSTFCSYGMDSQGYESPKFKIGPSGYSDSDTTCGNPMFTDNGEGFIRLNQTCQDGSKVSMELQLSGDDAIAVTQDGHEHTLKRCD